MVNFLSIPLHTLAIQIPSRGQPLHLVPIHVFTQFMVLGQIGVTGQNAASLVELVQDHANGIATILDQPMVEEHVKEFTRTRSHAVLVKFV